MKLKVVILDTISQIKKQIKTVRDWVIEHRERLRVKGRAHFTILIIPQSEQKSVSWSISYKAITIILGTFLTIVTLSTLIVLNSSSRDHEVYDLQVSNEDFIIQSQKLKTELRVVHETTNIYFEKIASLYLRLGGDPSKVHVLKDLEQLPYLEPTTDIFPESYRLQSDLYNIKLANELTTEIIKIIKDRRSIIQNTPSLWPTKGYILMPFGKYFSPLTGTESYNYGVDIGAFPGAEVVATAPGQVYEIGFSSITGNYIKIAHRYGWKTIYSNLERLQVKKGQDVSKGEIIGYVGKTSINPVYHLHYEVHVGTSPLNPHSFLNQIQN